MNVIRHVFLWFVVLALPTATQTIAAVANEPVAFGDWSPAVNGLQARLATLVYDPGSISEAFLELRNAGAKPLTIPSLAVSTGNKEFLWHLQGGQGRDWKDIRWIARVGMTIIKPDGPKQKSEPPVVLRPRETALMEIDGYICDRREHPQQIRMVLHQSGTGPVAGWSGTLATPPVFAHRSEVAIAAMTGLARALPAPNYFPPLGRAKASLANGTGLESSFLLLWRSNWQLLLQLRLYPDAPIARELDKRLWTESNFPVQLLLAVEAAGRGSAEGKQFILRARKNLDYLRCQSALDALGALAEYDNAPDWVFDEMIAALEDQRHITDLPPDWAEGTSLTVSLLGDEVSLLTFRLGHRKYRPAVPALIKLATNRDHQRFAIEALGEIGDPAAAPALFAIVKNERANLYIFGSTLEPRIYDDALRALVNLKAEGVEEELLTNVVHTDIVKMLEQMEDARALPVLRQLVSAGKATPIKGSDAESDRSSVEAARIALATLEPGDSVPRYCALVQDRSLTEFTRGEAVRRLGEEKHIDPRAIPVLLTTAREDPSGTVVDNAIEVLGGFRDRAAVSGLIELFGSDHRGEREGKNAYDPEMFRECIANSLNRITHQSFGVDAAAWRKWWSSQDQHVFR